MNTPGSKVYEQQAATAFTKQSSVFDIIYSSNSIIQYKRERVREHIERFLRPESFILELNAGTGEDAIYFAQNGHMIHATDLSAGMLDKLSEKIKARNKSINITHEVCSFTELEQLNNKGPYDHIFSNFAGLNCTNELKKVLDSFSSLLKEGGFVTLVLLPKFCLWEFMLLFRGKFRTAFRRFSGNKGSKAHIEGHYFQCWYYNPSFIRKHLEDGFKLIATEGLCTIVPPSYIENFSEKNPKLFEYLKTRENKWKNRWPWKFIGDYYIITLQKRS